MNRQTISAAVPPHWWERLRGAQFGFVAGLLVGLVMGWVFHGVISLAVRFGILVLLLLPLILIGWLWLRSQRSTPPSPANQQPPPGVSWQSMIEVQQARPAAPPTPPETPSFVDVPLVKPATESKPDDIEAELEALKRRRDGDA